MPLSVEFASMLFESFVFALAAVFVGDALWERLRGGGAAVAAAAAAPGEDGKQRPQPFQWGWFQLGNKLAVLGFVYSSAMMFKHGGGGHVNALYFGLAIACLAYFFTFFGVSIIRQLTSDQSASGSGTEAPAATQERVEPAAGKWGHLKLQAVRDMLCLVGRVTSEAETPYKHVLWRLTKNDKQSTVWSTYAPGSSSGIVRAISKLAVPVETVLNILIDDTRLPDYDNGYEGQDFVEKVDSHTFLRRMRYKGQWGMQPRDFVLLTTWCRLEDGTYLIASRSVPNDVWPANDKYVRGTIFVSGYHIAPLRGNPDETELTLVAHADLVGNLPRAMVDALLNTTPLELVAKIQELAMSDVSYRKLVSPLIKAPTMDMEARANLRAEGEDALFQLKTLHSQTESGKRTWNLLGEHVGVSVFESTQKESAWDLLRATCVVQASPNAVRDCLVEHYRKVNPLIATTQVLDRVHEDYAVVWAGTAELWPAGSHDFLVVTGVKALKAGGFVLAAKSTTYRTAPTCPTFKRCKLRLGGYVVTPTKAGHSLVTAYLNLDVDGYLPGWFSYLFCENAFPAHLCQIRAACRPGLPPVIAPDFQDALNRIRAKEKKAVAFGHPADAAQAASNSVQFRLVLNQITNPTTPTKKRAGKDDTASESGRRISSAAKNSSKSDALSESGRRPRADSNLSSSQLSSSPAPTRVRKPLFARNSSYQSTSAPSDNSKTETGSLVMLEGEAMTINEELDAAAAAAADTTAGKFDELYAKTAQEALELLAAFADIEGHPHDPSVTEPLQWREAANRKGVRVLSAPFKDSAWSVLRSETVFQCSADAIMKVVTDDERLRDFDDMFDRYELLDESTPHGRVRRFMFKAVWPTAPRDFIVLTTHKQLENGCYMVATRSVTNDVFPEESRFTRGRVMVSGYYLKPVAEGTEIIMCAHTDLGGTLPSTIINMLSTSAPIQLLNNLRRLCQQA